MKNTMKISQNLKTELPYNPSILLIRKDIWNLMFLAAIFTIANMKQPKCPSIDEQTNVVCVHNRILLSNKKEWNFATWNNMNGPRGSMLRKISQIEKDKHHRISQICGIRKTNELTWQNKHRLIDIENEEVVAIGGRCGRTWGRLRGAGFQLQKS